jgi:SpoVK/Ycf46/Vps4 family AAA+-type ATPase
MKELSVTDPVIAALSVALEAAPHIDLRLSLAERHLALGQPAQAMEHLTAALAEDPAHVKALGLAASAAKKLGMDTKAAAWRRLHAALSGSPGPAAVLTPAQDAPARLPTEGIADQPDVIRLVQPDALPASADVPGDPDRITFKDVGGLTGVKRRVDLSFLAPLRQPELYRAYGRSIKGGLLLYGPPGCGKTYLARATAGEVGARFTSIGLIDVLNMWVGESEKQLHELFENARRQAPVVLFLDELDALGQKRSQLRNRAGRSLVNQLLVELDGINSSEGVYVLAATNSPWDVDPALRRPGRFDRTVLVPPPDASAREHILSRHMAGRPQDGLDFASLAAQTAGYSGADLVHLGDTAIEGALEEALTGGALRPVHMSDFVRAIREVRPSIGPWVDVARNYAIYANEGGAYDELAAWLKSSGR